jgi:CII-binding regulator of phage lambda lysogenization HflD
MTTVIAVLSFAMAFGAIWFTSEAVKRLDNNNDAMLRPHFRKFDRALDENRDAIRALHARLEKLEKQVHLLKLVAEVPQTLEAETAAIHSGINELQRFKPTVRLNG